jgi:ferredoxin-NADP reductase
MQSFEIIKIIVETADAKTFVLHPADNSVVRYKAGQFLTLVFDTKFGEKRRSYSISSSPSMNEPISITIKKVENGEFSRLLLTKAKGGDVLNSPGINGLFSLPEIMDDVDQLFFLAAGSGITPCFSMIKTLLATTKKQVVLIYSNRQESDTIFYNQLVDLQRVYPNQFSVRFLYSSSIDINNGRLSSGLLQQFLKAYLVTEKSRAYFYLCGPFEYMQMINITLLSQAIPYSNIKKENFSDLPRLFKPGPPDIEPHMAFIHFEKKIHELVVQYPTTILAAAKAKNIAIPYSCEAGRCGSCVATCIKGKIWMAYNEVLMDEEIEKGRILCCQSYPVYGDVEIIV